MNLSDIKRYFKDIGCSFEQKQDKLKISRFVNGGNFAVLGINCIFLLLMYFAFVSIVLGAVFGKDVFILLAIIGSFIMPFLRYLIHITFTVNSKGVLAKTIDNKKYFIPREKIDCCISKKVKRYENKNSDEFDSFYCIVIKLNEISDNPIKLHEDVLSNVKSMLSGDFLSNLGKVRITGSEVDTGLCYESKKPAKYLANEFNKYLGIEIVEEKKVKSKEKDTDKKSKKKTKDTKEETVKEKDTGKKSKKKNKDTEEKTVKEKDTDKKSKKKTKDTEEKTVKEKDTDKKSKKKIKDKKSKVEVEN